MNKITHFISIIFIWFVSNQSLAQTRDYLDYYIQVGLNQNLTINQQKLEVEKSYQDLRSARSTLLPTIDLNARYTKASGGRSFQMPLGDLMNPVYGTLNSLVGEGTFQNIDNQELNFNRTTDIDTRVSVLQPIYDSRLLLQNKIQNDVTAMTEVDLSIAKRDFVFEIKRSYYNYLKVLKLKELLNATRGLVEENLRVSEVLHANDKVTEDAVWRSKTEIRKVDFQIADAEKQYQMSKRKFNQLLNRTLTDSIHINVMEEVEIRLNINEYSNFKNREELEQVLVAQNVAHQQGKLASANNIPNFYLALDAGFQGTSYAFDSESDYFLASAVMSWNLFSGFKNSSQKQKAKIEQERLRIRYKDIANGIQLQVEDARLEFEKSNLNYATTVAAEAESKANFKIVNRKFEEGLANQVELIDARTFMTNASAENIIARYDLLISKAAFERATASYLFKSSK